MNEVQIYYPDRRGGIIFHGALVLLLTGIASWTLWQASQATIGLTFLLYLIPATFAILVIPFLVNRAIALNNAYYQLRQDGIYLRWGLRVEEIPMNVIEWIHPAEDLEPEVPLPRLRWPGAILGKRHVAGGIVEFMASKTRGMLVISTTEKRAYAISPVDPERFMREYRRLVEYGSISPIPSRSVYPSSLISRMWNSIPARLLILSGILFGLILFIYIMLTIPNQETIPLGFLPNGEPGVQVPTVRLMLLPVISWFFFFIDLFLGLFFFRTKQHEYLAYISWGIGALTPILFLVGSYFILQSGQVLIR